jgi:hypothetical protein
LAASAGSEREIHGAPGFFISGPLLPCKLLPFSRRRQSAPRLTVELRDGSRVVGESVEKNFKFHSALQGDWKLAVKDICTVECTASNTVNLTMANGDTLNVKLVDSLILVGATFGKVELPTDLVCNVSVFAGGHSLAMTGVLAGPILNPANGLRAAVDARDAHEQGD